MTPTDYDSIRTGYLDLIKRSITNYTYLGRDASFDSFRCVVHYDLARSAWKIDPLARPLTLLTKGQLDLLEEAVLNIEKQGVPGHLLEAGVWRGGAIILMRALVGAYGMRERRVFAADSFAGIPLNTSGVNDPVDLWKDRWVASLDEVGANLDRFGMLDDRIRFVVGEFSESLKHLDGERFALIRLDSDSYDSVGASLDYLYPLVSEGGITIVDDWHLPGCRSAVMDYRARHGIEDEIEEAHGNAYWVKQQPYGSPRRGQA